MADEKPDDINEIRKNPKLYQALAEHMKKGQSIENLQFYFDNGNMEGVFAKWITPKDGNEVVNLPSEILSKLREQAEAEEWGEMKNTMKKAKERIKQLVERDVLPRFYASKEYVNYLKKEKMGDPSKAAKILGISNVKLLTRAMQAAAEGEDAEAKKLFEQLAKEEELKENYAQIVKALEKAGML
jgi:hypothetical protein